MVALTVWTDDRVAILRKLHLEGLSYKVIGERLGGVTDKAVQGKANSIGLYRGQRAQKRSTGALTRTLTQEANNQVTTIKRKLAGTYDSGIELKDLDPEIGDISSIHRLKDHHCRYTTDSETFCGAHKSIFGGSYCDRHAFICNAVWPPRAVSHRTGYMPQPYDGPVRIAPTETPLDMLVR